MSCFRQSLEGNYKLDTECNSTQSRSSQEVVYPRISDISGGNLIQPDSRSITAGEPLPTPTPYRIFEQAMQIPQFAAC